MCVKHLILLENENSSSIKVYDVEGTSYAPEGEIS